MLHKVLRSKAFWVAALAGVLVITFGGAVTARLTDNGSTAGSLSTYMVQQGPLTISVTTSGTISNRDVEILKSEVEGQTQILYIVPEGTRVEEGELLVELDGSRLQDNLVDQEIKLQNAEASLISARENFEVTKNQAQSEIDKAELAYELAKMDLQKYLEGDFPAELKTSEVRLTLTRADLKRAEEKLKGSHRLAEKNFITTTELEADQQAALKAQLDLELAEENRKVLTDFTHRRMMAQLESDVSQSEMALERVQRKAHADIVQAEADLKAKEAQFRQEQGKFEKNKEQLVKTKIYAPTDGLVVYATSSGGGGGYRGGGSQEPLDEGQMVRERQELIHLPKDSLFKASVQVHESSLAKIRPGLPVIVTADGVPGQSYRGRVSRIAPLPDAQSAWMNPDLKVYSTEILIDEGGEGLRTGMSCQANILVERYNDAVYVPVQSVVRVAGTPTVYVVDRGGVVSREVELGLDNNRMIHITSGLTPGELVMLTPPLAAGEKDESEEEADVVSVVATDIPIADAPGSERPRDGQRRPRDAQDRPEGGADRDAMMERFRNASPEEQGRMREEFMQREGQAGEGAGGERPRGGGDREAMMERFQNATPEEQARMREEFQRRQQDGGGRQGGGRRQRGDEAPQP
jgi:HlyD family secretion protein